MSPGLWQDEPRWLRWAAHPGVFVIACSWLFVLVVVGTLAQRDIGLYAAQQQYFESWFFWLGWLPIPSGRLALSLTGLNLLAVLFTRRGTRNPGLFILHGGTLLLLGGAMVGGAFRQEGSLSLFEGERGSEIRSWHTRELAVLVAGERDDRLVTFGEGLLQPGATLTHPDLPEPLRVERVVANSRLQAGALVAMPSERESERNLLGTELVLPGDRRIALSEASDGVRLTPTTMAHIRRAGTELPFAIELIDFKREMHPGTGMARWFSSEVLVHEGGGSRRVVISMNQPLRIGAWTLYQQSYQETSQGEASVLAVVHDRFMLSPYISSAIMALGLLLHIIWRLCRLGESS